MSGTSIMRAAVTESWGRMKVREVRVPEPEQGEVRIAVRLAGICGSDVHIFQGHHPTALAPVVQGHELVGVVDAWGPGVGSGPVVGQRVVVEPLISCGSCEACRRGLSHVCRRLRLLGIHADGAFAGYVLAPAAKLIAVPESMDDEVAVMAEPFAVGVHVCQRAGLEPGERVLVLGAGPIGLVVAMVAATCGATVVVSEVNPQRIELAQAFGFTTLDASTDPGRAAAELTDDQGFDTCFEVAGVEAALSLALGATRVRGTIVQVGFHSKPPPVDLFRLSLMELSIVGSRVYRHEDFRRAVQLLDTISRADRFDLRQLITQRIGLDGIPSGIEQMQAGQVLGKILVDPHLDV